MNIVWKQPNGDLAYTSIWDGTDPMEYARRLQECPNPLDPHCTWIPLMYNYKGTIPDAPIETWVWSNGQILVDPEKLRAWRVPVKVSRYQARAALLQAGLLDDVEALMASPSADAWDRLVWENAQDFERASPTIEAFRWPLGLTHEQLDDLFVFASTITA